VVKTNLSHTTVETMANEALLYNALCSKPFAVPFFVRPAVTLVSFNFGRNSLLSRVLEKWEVCEVVAAKF
jgi:hypothetical protein